jgi:rubrerythrin
MPEKMEDILKGLKEAMEAELTGYNFYKNAAKNTSDEGGKETFSTMAEEEMGHFNFLRHQYSHVLEKGEYDLSKQLTKKGYKNADSPIFSNEIRKRIKDAHFEVSALTIGMKLELDAMNFYRSRAKESQDGAVKTFYNELADWEEEHYRAFSKALEGLKESYFEANNFVPM